MRSKKAGGQIEPDRVWGNKVSGIKRNSTVKWGAEAQRQKRRLVTFSTIRIKKKVCAHLTSQMPFGWTVSPFSSCSVQSMTYNAAKYGSCPVFLLQTNLPSFRDSCELLFIWSYQLSDLRSLNVIFICSSISRLIKVFFSDTLLTR